MGTVFEKYEYKSNGETKVILKKDISTLNEEEMKSISHLLTQKGYAEILESLKQATVENITSEILVDLTGMINISASHGFNSTYFESLINEHWQKFWRYS